MFHLPGTLHSAQGPPLPSLLLQAVHPQAISHNRQGQAILLP